MLTSAITPRALIHRTFGGVLPFNEWAGIDYLEASRAKGASVLPFRPDLADAAGVMSEGAVLSLADVVAGMTSVGGADGTRQVATSSLHMSLTEDIPAGMGLLGEGIVVAQDDDTMLIDIVIRQLDAPHMIVRRGRARMMVVRRIDADAPFEPDPPTGAWAADPAERGPFAAALGMRFNRDGDVLKVVMPFREVFMGNTARRAIHGGAVAAPMLEAAQRVAAVSEGAVATILDSNTEFLLPARDAALNVSARVHRAGRRFAFVECQVHQTLPDAGDSLVAITSVTLRR